jgi:hypothetical protein
MAGSNHREHRGPKSHDPHLCLSAVVIAGAVSPEARNATFVRRARLIV